MGGKARTAKPIAAYLESVRSPGQPYLEPFVGAANVLCRMAGPKTGADAHPDLIYLLQAVRDGSIDLPDSMTEEEYYRIRDLQSCALRGFAGFGCSFGGRFFMGFARAGPRNYCKNAKNSLLKKRPGLLGADFVHRDYREWDVDGHLIYCDPPYRGETQYTGPRGSTREFDSDEFWDVVRRWSDTNTVVVSEYTAPADFACVLELPTKTDIRTKAGVKEPRVERLFRPARGPGPSAGSP